MQRKKVLLGMSGGVDSSVAALLLQKQGYEVIGAFMKCFSESKNKLTGECAWVDERKMAQKVAAMLGIEFLTLDFEDVYKKEVIDPMFAAYRKGLTPNPDMTCNTIVKFPLLWKEAKKIGAGFIATGHYARIRKNKNGYDLLAGRDASKDQSYFLAELTQDDLSHTLFPIGDMTKTEVRRIARQKKFPNWDKHGTSGICFVGRVHMQDFLKQRIHEKKGNVIDSEGNILGTHRGQMYYTIGQKVGEHIGIHIEKPKELAQARWYVAEKKRNNTIVVAPEGHEALLRKEVVIKDMHIINSKERIPASGLKARIRHLGQLHSGKLVKRVGRWRFIFSKPIEAVAEGQYIVLYKGAQVVASGEIRIQ